jgi:glutamate synthase (ferredoxin)
MCKSNFKAIQEGYNIIILSDRGVSDKMAPIPMLLACSYVHHSMNILKALNLGSSLSPPNLVNRIICLLFGYGASAINPYLVNEIIRDQVDKSFIRHDS